MIDIHKALAQLRIARKLGKISNEVQARQLRRLGYAPAIAIADAAKLRAEQWQGMMGVLKSIHAEIAPAIAAKRQAERDCFDVRYQDDSKRRVAKVAPVVPVAAPVKREVAGYEYTPAWWKEQERKERNELKAKRQALRASGMTKEQAKAAIAAIEGAGVEAIDLADLDKEFSLA